MKCADSDTIGVLLNQAFGGFRDPDVIWLLFFYKSHYAITLAGHFDDV